MEMSFDMCAQAFTLFYQLKNHGGAKSWCFPCTKHNLKPFQKRHKQHVLPQTAMESNGTEKSAYSVTWTITPTKDKCTKRNSIITYKTTIAAMMVQPFRWYGSGPNTCTANNMLMMLIRYVFFLFGCVVKAPALASRIVVTHFGWVFVLLSRCFYRMQCITFFLFCSATFVSLLFKTVDRRASARERCTHFTQHWTEWKCV